MQICHYGNAGQMKGIRQTGAGEGHRLYVNALVFVVQQQRAVEQPLEKIRFFVDGDRLPSSYSLHYSTVRCGIQGKIHKDFP